MPREVSFLSVARGLPLRLAASQPCSVDGVSSASRPAAAHQLTLTLGAAGPNKRSGNWPSYRGNPSPHRRLLYNHVILGHPSSIRGNSGLWLTTAIRSRKQKLIHRRNMVRHLTKEKHEAGDGIFFCALYLVGRYKQPSLRYTRHASTGAPERGGGG